MLKINLFYYHIWNELFPGPDNKYPVVCSKPIDGWDGTIKNQTNYIKWAYEKMNEDGINYVLSNLGLYSSRYGITLKIYSMDTEMWYDNMDKLKEDLYTKILTGM